MSEDDTAWRENALEVYRLAMSILLSPRSPAKTVEEEYYIDELTEALLDLKLATVAWDEKGAYRSIAEIFLVLTQLRRLSTEE